MNTKKAKTTVNRNLVTEGYASRSYPTKLVCEHCGETFNYYPEMIKYELKIANKKMVYCSYNCRSKARKKYAKEIERLEQEKADRTNHVLQCKLYRARKKEEKQKNA